VYQFITVCALKHALLKAGAKPSIPYILVLLDIVLDFGISGQPRRHYSSFIIHHSLAERSEASLPVSRPCNALTSTGKFWVEARAL